MKRLFVTLAAPLLMIPFSASADELPELTNFIRQEISKGGRAFAKSDAAAGDLEEGFFFRRWLLRLQAQVGIDVPWIATFQIVPEVELVWERPFPDGWTAYKPNTGRP